MCHNLIEAKVRISLKPPVTIFLTHKYICSNMLNMAPVRINKRKRGGQPGNSNARRHGFYSPVLTIDETNQLWQAVYLEGSDPSLAMLRIKLAAVLSRNPDNRRVIGEAVRLLAAWYRDRYDLTGRDEAVFRKVIRRILETVVAKTIKIAATNRACGDKKLLETPKQIEAETTR